jgi:hypothetical protein
MNFPEKKLSVVELPPKVARASAGSVSSGLRPVFWLALLLALSCGLTPAQGSQTGAGQMANRAAPLDSGNFNPNRENDSTSDPVFRQKQLRLLNAEKHKSIVSNTAKLLKLATELNAQIGSTNPDLLTPDQLRMVAAIEKLAHSVKEDMRTPVAETPVILDPGPHSFRQ